MNAVHRLYQYRKELSTVVYKSRGHKLKRCEQCRISVDDCICSLTPKVSSNAGFLLLMYDTEILKPSNTGKLIADIVPDTFAFLWSRTEENAELLSLLSDDQWFPMVVFPAQYAEENRPVYTESIPVPKNKRPLFIMLDGSWREAKKMFRKSPYLNHFPVVAFEPELFADSTLYSRYQIRSAAVNNQLATAEVAARILAVAGEASNAHLMDLWFDVFSYQYQKSVCQPNKGEPQALENYQKFVHENEIELVNS